MHRLVQAHSEGRAVAPSLQVLDTSQTGVAHPESSAAPSGPPLHTSHTGRDIEPGTGENRASFVSAPRLASSGNPKTPVGALNTLGDVPTAKLNGLNGSRRDRHLEQRQPSGP